MVIGVAPPRTRERTAATGFMPKLAPLGRATILAACLCVERSGWMVSCRAEKPAQPLVRAKMMISDCRIVPSRNETRTLCRRMNYEHEAGAVSRKPLDDRAALLMQSALAKTPKTTTEPRDRPRRSCARSDVRERPPREKEYNIHRSIEWM